MKLRKILLVGALSVGMVLGLAACGSTEQPVEPNAAESVESETEVDNPMLAMCFTKWVPNYGDEGTDVIISENAVNVYGTDYEIDYIDTTSAEDISDGSIHIITVSDADGYFYVVGVIYSESESMPGGIELSMYISKKDSDFNTVDDPINDLFYTTEEQYNFEMGDSADTTEMGDSADTTVSSSDDYELGQGFTYYIIDKMVMVDGSTKSGDELRAGGKVCNIAFEEGNEGNAWVVFFSDMPEPTNYTLDGNEGSISLELPTGETVDLGNGLGSAMVTKRFDCPVNLSGDSMTIDLSPAKNNIAQIVLRKASHDEFFTGPLEMYFGFGLLD